MANKLYFTIIKFTPNEDMHFWQLMTPDGKVLASAHNSSSTQEEMIENCVAVFGPALLDLTFIEIDNSDILDKILVEYNRQFPIVDTTKTVLEETNVNN